MNVTDTDVREEQRSRLDEFAAAPVSRGELVPAATYMPPMQQERHGALKVEVARSTALVRSTLSELGAMLGERGYYRWPVKNKRKGTTDWVEGVSIKGAMALMKAYRNCRVSCPVIVDLGTHWRIHAVFVDFEAGVEVERSFMQRKSIAGMGDDVARKEDLAYQVGQSKAERNVILNALEIEADILLEECKGSIIDRVGANLEKYRQLISGRAKERGLDVARIEAVAGRAAKDWLAPDMVKIIAMMAAVSDGMATMDETFPRLGEPEQADEREMVRNLDHFAAGTEQNGPGRPPETPAASPAAAPVDAPPSSARAAAPIGWDAEGLIDRTLGIASVGNRSEQERMEDLDSHAVWLEEEHPGRAEFVGTLMTMAVKVAKGQLAKEAARKYLQALAK